LYEFTMTPEDAVVARTSDEPERLFGMFIDGWVKLADDIVEYTG
jgi:hypothetical protein